MGPPTLRGREGQHTILPKFPKNCMKLKEFVPQESPSRSLRICHRTCRSCFACPLWGNSRKHFSPQGFKVTICLVIKNSTEQDDILHSSSMRTGHPSHGSLPSGGGGGSVFLGGVCLPWGVGSVFLGGLPSWVGSAFLGVCLPGWGGWRSAFLGGGVSLHPKAHPPSTSQGRAPTSLPR